MLYRWSRPGAHQVPTMPCRVAVLPGLSVGQVPLSDACCGPFPERTLVPVISGRGRGKGAVSLKSPHIWSPAPHPLSSHLPSSQFPKPRAPFPPQSFKHNFCHDRVSLIPGTPIHPTKPSSHLLPPGCLPGSSLGHPKPSHSLWPPAWPQGTGLCPTLSLQQEGILKGRSNAELSHHMD